MGQSIPSKDVNTEGEESMALGAVTKQRLVKTADWEALLRSVVNCKVRKLTTAPWWIVVTSYKRQINSITNQNTESSQ
jgi:hypothetical protein